MLSQKHADLTVCLTFALVKATTTWETTGAEKKPDLESIV